MSIGLRRAPRDLQAPTPQRWRRGGARPRPTTAPWEVPRDEHDGVFQQPSTFEDELEDLDVESSPSFVRQPEGDECVERFIRTLKQRLLWMHWFRTVEALNPTLRDFRCRFNGHWIIGRIDDRTATTRQRILFGNAA